MKIGVISLKGGVGKTFIVANLASYLTKNHNKKVLVIDFSGESSNIVLYIKEKPIIQGERLWQGIIVTPYFHLKIVRDIKEDYDKDLELLNRVYDYIIFDTPPIYNVIKNVEKWSDLVFLVLNPDYLTIFTNYVLYKYLDKGKVKIILNKYNKELDPDIISAIFEKYISVIIPFSKDVAKSMKHLLPTVFYNPNSKITKAIDDIAYIITGKRKKGGILEIIKSIFLI